MNADDLPRRSFEPLGRLGSMHSGQFAALGIAAIFALLGGTLLVFLALDAARGRSFDHPIGRVMFLLLGLAAMGLVAVIVRRVFLEIRLFATGQVAAATITAIKRRDDGLWRNHYRFQEAAGAVREGSFVTRVEEWRVGDGGEVRYRPGRSRSLWVSESKRTPPIPELGMSPERAIAQGIATVAVTALVLSALAAGLLIDAWMAGDLARASPPDPGMSVFGIVARWMVLTAFLVPGGVIATLILGPFVLVLVTMVRAALYD